MTTRSRAVRAGDPQTPRATIIVLMATGWLQVWQLIIGSSAAERAAYSFGIVPAVVSGRAALPVEIDLLAQPWPLLSAGLLHTSPLHALLNLPLLWWLGASLEQSLGSRRLTLLLVSCVVIAGLIEVAGNPASTIPVIGLDAAIAGLLGAAIVRNPGRPIPCPGFERLRLGPIVLTPAYFGLTLACAALVAGPTSGFTPFALLVAAVAGAMLMLFLSQAPLLGGQGSRR